MSQIRGRLLLASPSPGFLAEFATVLGAHFEIQRAGSEQMTAFLTEQWDPMVVLLDADSPMASLVHSLRQKKPLERMGIILIARDLRGAKEESALRAGADHYSTYPKSGSAMLARIESLLKRLLPANGSAIVQKLPIQRETSLISFGDLSIFPGEYLIKRGDRVVAASPTQFRLLLTLLSHRDQLLSRQWIKERVWEASEISPRSIDAQISKLKKLIPELEPHLINVYGKGYVLTDPKRQAA